jgi:pimeloyl-ACP methyl ester carboxylesterase
MSKKFKSTLPRNCPGNRAIIERKLISVFFLFELTDDNKTRQWDGLFTNTLFIRSMFLFFFALLLSTLYCKEGPVNKANLKQSAVKNTTTAKEEITFVNGAATLRGTLFLPVPRQNCPALVLLAGSDRSARGPLRLKIARHFAGHNIAALVYDSPGTGASTGNALLQTFSDRVIEALAAVDFLRKKQGFKSVGIFGGSEGADVALAATAKDPGIAFVIVASGPIGGSIFDTMTYSAEAKGYKQGLTGEEITKAITFKEIAFAFLTGLDILEGPLIKSRVSRWHDDNWLDFMEITEQRRHPLSPPQKQALLTKLKKILERFNVQRWYSIVDPGNRFQQLVHLKADYFFTLLEKGPLAHDWERNLRPEIPKIRCPLLAIWGENDSFLPPRRSAMMLKKYLTGANHPDFEIKIFENASHFLTVPGSRDEFVPGYLDKLVAWLNKHTR